MQSSYASIEIGHRDSRERSTPFTSSSSSYLPASLVQNILGCQAQALEAKANKVIQQENSALRQRIEHLENQLWSLKKKNSLRNIDNGDDIFSEDMDIDIKKPDAMEVEKENRDEKHQKELENSNKEWSEKYSELQKKYDQQSKDYQDLKDHYKQRSSEWKLTKQWIENAKRLSRARKGKSDGATAANAESRARCACQQDNNSPTTSDDKSSGTLTDVTNVQNHMPHTHVNNVSIISIDSASTQAPDNKRDCGNSFHDSDNQYQSDILSSNLSLNSLGEKSQSDHQYIQDSTELWNNNQKISDKALSCESSSSVTDQTNLDHDNAEILKRQKDVDFGPLDGTNAEHPIDIDDYDDNLFLADDDDQSSSKKRSADVVIKQEQDDSNTLPPLENNQHKRWKLLPSGKDRYSLDNDIVNTPHQDYRDPLMDDNKPVASERISNDGEESPMLLTPITPHNIRNKNTSHRSTVSPNLSETNIRFNETVRKQSERRQLQGEDCRDCRRYYEITGPMPIPDATGLNRCGHTNQVQSAELLMEARLHYTSKHRTKYSRAPTPPGFWRVGFPTSQELAETNEQSIEYEKSREDQKRKENEYLKNREHKWDRI
ncbi:11102_t:CDS:2 [Racocetra fulgida]|uniref:11102_t:CDS:1 n=1 Tax=Racocetra fulgida TaxID=60492 RepID=A0A9N9A9X5_9GLOM|nr:11102_t:CDS:2 [Racocetra fulgida]